jgi:DNA-binding LacI/PurR family transcriptional regulator
MVKKSNSINIKDIARLAGVSITTVSHTISGKRYVKESTKKKIFKIIKKYHYEPNIIARSLIKKESNLVGVITTELNNEFYSEIIEGVESTLSPLGYILIINSSHYDPKKELDVFRKLNSLLIDGLILIGGSAEMTYIEKLNNRKIPVVLINRKCQESIFPSVMVNYKKSITEVVNHLSSKGHKKIGYIGWKENREKASKEKFEGYLEGLKVNNLNKNDKNIFLKNNIMFDGFKEANNTVREEFKNSKDISAIVCQTDQIALGTIKALKELNYKVPQDICVAGFGDLSIGRYSDPALTTISVPKKDMGIIGANTFLKIHTEKTQSKECVLLDSPLIIRNST